MEMESHVLKISRKKLGGRAMNIKGGYLVFGCLVNSYSDVHKLHSAQVVHCTWYS